MSHRGLVDSVVDGLLLHPVHRVQSFYHRLTGATRQRPLVMLLGQYEQTFNVLVVS